MEKEKIVMEFGLMSKSVNIVWSHISTIEGLSLWFADNVTEEGDILIFSWGDIWTAVEERRAEIVAMEKYHYVRMRWIDDEEPESYWELRISKGDETDTLHLVVTDFAEKGEETEMRSLWDENMEKLHKVSGI